MKQKSRGSAGKGRPSKAEHRGTGARAGSRQAVRAPSAREAPGRKGDAGSHSIRAKRAAGHSGSTRSALLRRLDEMAGQIRRLEDTQAVRSLHFKYGYYIDMCLYDEACDLFADDGEVRFLNGVYRGKAGARRLYCEWFRNLFTRGHNGPVHGFLLDHLQLQDIVDVAPDGRTAQARFRALLLAGQHETKAERIQNFPTQCWEGGIYENLYIKDAGVWKIKRLNYNMLWQANYEPGWAKSGVHLPALTQRFPQDPCGPDELLPTVPNTWPNTRVVPFHYPHPTTGKPWK